MIRSGNKDYSVEIKDPSILDVKIDLSSPIGMGNLDIYPKQKGETTIQVKDNIAHETTDLRIKIVDSYLHLSINNPVRPPYKQGDEIFYNKYRSVHKHLRQYIRERYGRPDIGFSEITPEFVTGFHAFLSQQARCSANTIWIYLIAFKHILKLACSEGLLRRNPLGDYKLHSEFVSRNFLTLDELNRILALDLHDRTMQLVRDGFIFSCFTGLSYSDLCNLTRRHVEQTGDQWWIRTKRCKTGTPVTVRLFELPAAILRNHALGREDDPIFTLPSNGWCNACLDKIAARAGIPKKITFHVARHTFATTITLSQGVTIETISKLLGHKNIRTTQIYATITHAKLSGELEQLSRRIDTLFDRTNMQSRGGL